MTICIATSNFPPQTGGIAACYGHLAAILTLEGHRVIVLVPDNSSTGTEDAVEIKDGFTIVSLRKKYRACVKKYARYFPPGGLDAPAWIAAGIAMKEWLLQNQSHYSIDIIEVSDYGGAGIFLVQDQLPPLVVTGHGAFVQLKPYNSYIENSHTRLVSQMEMLSFQQADGVIAHSPLNQKELEQLTGREIQFARAPWQPAGKKRTDHKNNTVLTAGGLQQVKGAIVMATAVTNIAAQHTDFKVYWAGEDTFTAPGAIRMSEYLEKKYTSIWNADFTWLKELSPEETHLKIAAADMVVIPSLWETFNYTVLEAVAQHTPVIISDKTGAAYLFTHDRDAWIIPAGDAESLARAIIHLQNNPAVRDRLAAQAVIMIEQTFTRKKIVEERIAGYTKIIESRKLRQPVTTGNPDFLQPYLTTRRKYYFAIKAILKKWIGRRLNE